MRAAMASKVKPSARSSSICLCLSRRNARLSRAALGWGVRELAEKACVTANTVTRIENGADAKQSTIDALRVALETGGVEFIPENGGGAGVRLRKGVASG